MPCLVCHLFSHVFCFPFSFPFPTWGRSSLRLLERRRRQTGDRQTDRNLPFCLPYPILSLQDKEQGQDKLIPTLHAHSFSFLAAMLYPLPHIFAFLIPPWLFPTLSAFPMPCLTPTPPYPIFTIPHYHLPSPSPLPCAYHLPLPMHVFVLCCLPMAFCLDRFRSSFVVLGNPLHSLLRAPAHASLL